MPKSHHVGKVRTCQVCNNTDLKQFLSLGHHAVPQEYLSDKKLYEMEPMYPLGLVFCKKCTLVQLDYIVPPEIVFPKNYPYRTGLTNMLLRNFEQLAESMKTSSYLKNNDLIIDIGSNDGSLLKSFKTRGMKVLGIEPTDAADVANRNKIPTIKDYLNKSIVTKIVKKYGKAKIITATNVFAHINDTRSLINNISSLLEKDGVFVSESQYLMDIIEKLEFDTVYHEHLRFYSLRSIKYFLEISGFSVIDAERITAAGGSIRVYSKKGKHQTSARAREILAHEGRYGLGKIETYNKFATRVLEAKYALVLLLLDIKRKGGRIVGLTSSCRSNTLLSFMKITDDILDYTGEKNGSPKIGMFTPGMHIPVLDESKIIKDQPEFLLILSWHIGTELAAIMRKIGYKGKFIIPLPTPKIVD